MLLLYLVMIFSSHNHFYSISKTFKDVTHCIFDLDGTILDSERLYHDNIKKLCKNYGKIYTKDQEKRMYGATDKHISETLVKEFKLKVSAVQFQRELEMLCNTTLPYSPLRKGIERLLYHLHDHGILIAIATNSTEHSVRLHLKNRPKIFGIFHHVVMYHEQDICHHSSEVCVTDPEVYRGKPHPDLYLVTAARFPDKPKPVKCLVFEDSAVGATAAKAAGMQVILTPYRRIKEHERNSATLILRSILDFKPELFGLPAFTDNSKETDSCFCIGKRLNIKAEQY